MDRGWTIRSSKVPLAAPRRASLLGDVVELPRSRQRASAPGTALGEVGLAEGQPVGGCWRGWRWQPGIGHSRPYPLSPASGVCEIPTGSLCVMCVAPTSVAWSQLFIPGPLRPHSPLRH